MEAKCASGSDAGCVDDGLLRLLDSCTSVWMLDGVAEEPSTSLTYSENQNRHKCVLC